MKMTIEKVLERKNLDYLEMKDVMDAIMEGAAPPIQVAAFLAALRVKGETPEEIRAAAEVMRGKAKGLNVKKEILIDIVGTGGDGKGTFNISTAAALVTAAGGVVGQHGGHQNSSFGDLRGAPGPSFRISGKAGDVEIPRREDRKSQGQGDTHHCPGTAL